MSLKFEMSKEASIILKIVENSKPGNRLTFAALQNATGVNDLTKLRGYIYTAFRRALNEWQMKFQSVRGIGYVRLDENGKNVDVSGRIYRIRRAAKRTSRFHEAVAFNTLDAEGKLRHATNGIQIAEIKRAASRSLRNKIATNSAPPVLVLDGTLEMFKRRRA